MRTISIALAISGVLGGQASAQSASPTPSPSPLTLDVEKHVDQVLAEQASKGTPRFETTIEVVGKSPQIMLERFFGGVDDFAYRGPKYSQERQAQIVDTINAFLKRQNEAGIISIAPPR